jgi:hypothetical protein
MTPAIAQTALAVQAGPRQRVHAPVHDLDEVTHAPAVFVRFGAGVRMQDFHPMVCGLHGANVSETKRWHHGTALTG